MKYAYYPGCSAKSTCNELDVSTQAVAEKLGLELVELEVAACTGAREVRDKDPELFYTLNARTLALAEKLGLDLVTVCATCQLNLAEVNHKLKNDEALREKINRNLAGENLRYEGKVAVKHFLWILSTDVGFEKLKSLVKRPLTGLKVAPFYGCHILRPAKILGFDDPDNPTSLENVFRILGAEPVEYRGKSRCCGFHVLLSQEEIALKMSGRHLGEAKQKEADCLVTTCPLCHTALDPYQESIEKVTNQQLQMPILHLAQLLGLAFGMEPDELKLSSHVVSVQPVLDKILQPA